uniref:Uncharacterized protein n=1 Tax=Anopheles farauti TaxID=69004 RepID=A0A182QUJ5_9DIPT
MPRQTNAFLIQPNRPNSLKSVIPVGWSVGKIAEVNDGLKMVSQIGDSTEMQIVLMAPPNHNNLVDGKSENTLCSATANLHFHRANPTDACLVRGNNAVRNALAEIVNREESLEILFDGESETSGSALLLCLGEKDKPPELYAEFVALIAISCTLFLFLHTQSLTSRLREMEDRLQPSSLSAASGLSGNSISQAHRRKEVLSTWKGLV